MYRYEPRQNDAVNATWMCDYGRLNYKWVNREDRLDEVLTQTGGTALRRTTWGAALREIGEILKRTGAGTAAIVASARQSNEELWLLSKLKTKFNALSDSIPRHGESDKLLLAADRNPNSMGAKIMGICGDSMGTVLPRIRDGINAGAIRTLLVFGEDLTKHGIDVDCLRKLDTLIVSDILPSATTALAHYLLPGCAHLEKRGSFTNVKGRVQRFTKALEPKGESRAEWEFLHELVYNVTGQNGFVTIEGLFNQMAREVAAFAGLTWAGLGDAGEQCQF